MSNTPMKHKYSHTDFQKFDHIDMIVTQPTTANKSAPKMSRMARQRTPPKSRKKKRESLKRSSEIDDCKVGNVQVVIRRKRQKQTDKGAEFLFDLLSQGKVHSLMSLKRTVKENDHLKLVIEQKMEENQGLNQIIVQLKGEIGEFRENESYLVNQVRESQQINDEITQDLEISTTQNQELIRRIKALTQMQKELLLKVDQQTATINTQAQTIAQKTLYMTQFQEKTIIDKDKLNNKIVQGNIRKHKLEEENAQLMHGFVEQSKALDQNNIQINNLMGQKKTLERDIIQKYTQLNNLNSETQYLQNTVANLTQFHPPFPYLPLQPRQPLIPPPVLPVQQAIQPMQPFIVKN